MSPDLTRELVIDLRAWYEESDVSQKNLARKLFLSPQQLSEIFAGRNRPTGDQVLRIQEFLRTNMKTDYLDPRTKPRQAAGNPGPKTLTEARERISDLEAQLRGSAKPAAVPAPPKAKAQSPAGEPGPDPALPPITTPGADRLAPTPMPASPKPPTKSLPVNADTPFKITEILKLENLDSLLLLLANPAHTPLQRTLIYEEIKKVRSLVAGRGPSLN